MAKRAHAYLGQFANNTTDFVLVPAYDFQDALYWCDLIALPDTGSFEALRDPLVIRFRASLAWGEDADGDPAEGISFEPHPQGAVVLGGRDLARILDRVKNQTSSITDDMLRLVGGTCSKCGFTHPPSMECKIFLEPKKRLVLFLGYTNNNPQDVFVVAGPDDEDDLLDLAKAAGPEPRLLMPVEPAILFGLQVRKDGSIHSDPELTCYNEAENWEKPLQKLLRRQQRQTANKKRQKKP